MGLLEDVLRKFRSIREVTSVDEVARRYFVMNAFDGSLTMLGIILGGYATGDIDANAIVSTGLGAIFAMGISGAWGAYMAEKAERMRSIKELEDAMHADLKDSMLYRASRLAAVWVSLVDGLSPAIGALISMSPFVFSQRNLLSLQAAVHSAIILNMATLFILGIFLGKVSRESIIVHGFLMVIAGFVMILLSLLLGIHL